MCPLGWPLPSLVAHATVRAGVVEGRRGVSLVRSASFATSFSTRTDGLTFFGPEGESPPPPKTAMPAAAILCERGGTQVVGGKSCRAALRRDRKSR